MSEEKLTAALAARIMGWDVAPERFLLGRRCWMPRWRFQPASRLQDAFRLLERLAPQEYAMGEIEGGGFSVRVRVAGVTGESKETSKPRALTFAIARAVGIDVASVDGALPGIASNPTRSQIHEE